MSGINPVYGKGEKSIQDTTTSVLEHAIRRMEVDQRSCADQMRHHADQFSRIAAEQRELERQIAQLKQSLDTLDRRSETYA